MTQLWAILGAACIDPDFREKLFDDKEQFQAVLDPCRVWLSNYEFGEALRWFRGPQKDDFQKALDRLEPFLWKSKTPCLTGIAGNPYYVPITPEELEPLQEKLAAINHMPEEAWRKSGPAKPEVSKPEKPPKPKGKKTQYAGS